MNTSKTSRLCVYQIPMLPCTFEEADEAHGNEKNVVICGTPSVLSISTWVLCLTLSTPSEGRIGRECLLDSSRVTSAKLLLISRCARAPTSSFAAWSTARGVCFQAGLPGHFHFRDDSSTLEWAWFADVDEAVASVASKRAVYLRPTRDEFPAIDVIQVTATGKLLLLKMTIFGNDPICGPQAKEASSEKEISLVFVCGSCIQGAVPRAGSRSSTGLGFKEGKLATCQAGRASVRSPC